MFWAVAALIVTVFAGCFVLPGGTTPAEAQTAVEAGYRDHSYAGTGSPTGEKPQSKLWFNDGSWWGVLWDPVSDDYHVYRFNWQTNSWSDTGTLIDGRYNAKADVLWDGTKLYVATAPDTTSTSDQNAYVRRYSYDTTTRSYSLDSNFPVKVASGRVEAIVLDKDSTGRLWVTYAQGGKVYVNASQGGDASWGTPFVPQVNGASNLTSDDISSVVAFDRKTAAPQVGLMWSNQNNDAMYWATHKDGDPAGAWQASRTAVAGPDLADDHINLRSVQVDDATGRVFAAVKTSASGANQPLIFLSVLGGDGNWTNHIFGRVQDDHTRPIVAIDEENRVLHMFATAPVSPGGTIYHKQTPLGNISFSEGRGTPFIKSSTDTTINDTTSTKQAVNSRTDLLVLAGDDTTNYYLHNTLDIPAGVSSPQAPETTVDSGPSGTVSSSSASFAFSSSEAGSAFECSLDDGPYGACASPADYTNLSDGRHDFSVRAIDADGNADASPATRSWYVDSLKPTVAGIAPTDGARDMLPSVNVEATFSEAMDASTINGSTFTLSERNADGNTTPVAAAVGYDPQTNKATLDPEADLNAGATYTVAIAGGTGGAKDAAGNPLEATRTWSYSVAKGPDECTVLGTADKDVLKGTEAADVICGLGGNDTIEGLGGDDILRGGEGYDTASFETAPQGIDASLVTGVADGEGHDELLGIERLMGSVHNDALTGSDRYSALTGNAGNDTLRGQGGGDIISGWTGDDVIYAGPGKDSVRGGSGADTLHGEDGDDELHSQDGVEGNDSLDGGAGADTKVTDAAEASVVNFP